MCQLKYDELVAAVNQKLHLADVALARFNQDTPPPGSSYSPRDSREAVRRDVADPALQRYLRHALSRGDRGHELGLNKEGRVQVLTELREMSDQEILAAAAYTDASRRHLSGSQAPGASQSAAARMQPTVGSSTANTSA